MTNKQSPSPSSSSSRVPVDVFPSSGSGPVLTVLAGRQLRLLLGILAGAVITNLLTMVFHFRFLSALFFGVLVAYLPSYLDGSHRCVSLKQGSRLWGGLVSSSLWTWMMKYFPASLYSHYDFSRHAQSGGQFVFAVHPHGMLSVDHALFFTDAVGFNSKVAPLPRRDLGASVIFLIPGLRELCLWLGVVDAGSSTASSVLAQGYSMQLYPGGIQEQLATDSEQPKVVARGRKGFIKLALSYDVPIVPVYVFGEDKLYTSVSWFISFRRMLVKKLRIGIPLFVGRLDAFGLLPHRRPLHAVLGKPIWPRGVDEQSQQKLMQQRREAIQIREQEEKNRKRGAQPQTTKPAAATAAGTEPAYKFIGGRRTPRVVTQDEIEEMHTAYLKGLHDLFEEHKGSQPGYEKATLQILDA